MSEPMRVEPRARTPVPGAPENLVTGRLPEELLSEQVQRFGVFAAVAGGLWAFGMGMHALILPRTVGGPATTPTIIAIEIFAIVFSVVSALYVRFVGHHAATKANAGLVFMLVNAFLVAMVNVS